MNMIHEIAFQSADARHASYASHARARFGRAAASRLALSSWNAIGDIVNGTRRAALMTQPETGFMKFWCTFVGRLSVSLALSPKTPRNDALFSPAQADIHRRGSRGGR